MLTIISFLIPATLLVILLGHKMMHKRRHHNQRRSFSKVMNKLLRDKPPQKGTGNRVIALDSIKKLLLVADHHAVSPRVINIPLGDVASTILVHHKNAEGLVDKICLDLVEKKGRLLCPLDFFHHDLDPLTMLPSAARRAFYWKCRIDNYREMTAHEGYAGEGRI